MAQILAGYLGRIALGIGLALVLAATGVILARMGLLLFGLTSWTAWLTMLIAGAGVGGGLGSGTAWLWLKGMGNGFTALLFLFALASGVLGSWFAYQFGAGVETECCSSPAMGPIAYAILGAVLASNAAALLCGIIGRNIVRLLRHRQSGLVSSGSRAQ